MEGAAGRGTVGGLGKGLLQPADPSSFCGGGVWACRGCAIFAAVCQEEKKNPARLSKFRKRAGKIMQSQTARNEHRRKPRRWVAARFQMGRLVWPAEKPRRFSSAVGTAAGRLTWSLNGEDFGMAGCWFAARFRMGCGLRGMGPADRSGGLSGNDPVSWHGLWGLGGRLVRKKMRADLAALPMAPHFWIRKPPAMPVEVSPKKLSFQALSEAS